MTGTLGKSVSQFCNTKSSANGLVEITRSMRVAAYFSRKNCRIRMLCSTCGKRAESRNSVYSSRRSEARATTPARKPLMKSSYAGCWLSRLANTRTFCFSLAVAVSVSRPSPRVAYIHAITSTRVKAREGIDFPVEYECTAYLLRLYRLLIHFINDLSLQHKRGMHRTRPGWIVTFSRNEGTEDPRTAAATWCGSAARLHAIDLFGELAVSTQYSRQPFHLVRQQRMLAVSGRMYCSPSRAAATCSAWFQSSGAGSLARKVGIAGSGETQARSRTASGSTVVSPAKQKLVAPGFRCVFIAMASIGERPLLGNPMFNVCEGAAWTLAGTPMSARICACRSHG